MLVTLAAASVCTLHALCLAFSYHHLSAQPQPYNCLLFRNVQVDLCPVNQYSLIITSLLYLLVKPLSIVQIWQWTHAFYRQCMKAIKRPK